MSNKNIISLCITDSCKWYLMCYIPVYNPRFKTVIYRVSQRSVLGNIWKHISRKSWFLKLFSYTGWSIQPKSSLMEHSYINYIRVVHYIWRRSEKKIEYRRNWLVQSFSTLYVSNQHCTGCFKQNLGCMRYYFTEQLI